MNTFILRWNPAISSYKMEEHKINCKEIKLEPIFYNWSVREWQDLHAGDAFVLLQVGQNDFQVLCSQTVLRCCPRKSYCSHSVIHDKIKRRKGMSSIQIQQKGITDIPADAIVNAANTGLWAGGGVCGAIFRKAGMAELSAACERIGHCDEGSAVITPGFGCPCTYIIHAVGPRYLDGKHGEPENLYGAYKRSLELCREHGIHSVVFPLISAGIFGYPLHDAWAQAIQACRNFIAGNQDYNLDIIFAIPEDEKVKAGKEALQKIAAQTAT